MDAIRQEALDFAGIGLYRYDFEGRILFMDRGALKIFDLQERFPDPRAVADKNIEDLIIYTGPRGFLRNLVRSQGRVRGLEYSFKTLTGLYRWVLHDSYLVVDPVTHREVIQVIIRDITPRMRAREILRRIRKVLEIMDNCHRILAQFKNESSFLQELCDLITGRKIDYLAAWVGCDGRGPQAPLSIVARSGCAPGFPLFLEPGSLGAGEGCTPAALALATGKPFVASNIHQDPKFLDWREVAASFGFDGFIALPLVGPASPLGVLAIYTAQPDAFQEEEATVLMVLARGIAQTVQGKRLADPEPDGPASPD